MVFFIQHRPHQHENENNDDGGENPNLNDVMERTYDCNKKQNRYRQRDHNGNPARKILIQQQCASTNGHQESKQQRNYE